MARARALRLVLIGVIIALAGIACAATPEEQVLMRFFEASRALDSTALSRLATVTFNPRTDGSIQLFSMKTAVRNSVYPRRTRNERRRREASVPQPVRRLMLPVPRSTS
jgi:hypothetical protein